MKKVLILGAIVLFLVAGCATLQFNPDPYSSTRLTGKMAAFTVLKNNPSFIPEVEALIKAAIERAESPTLDVSVLLQDIQKYCADAQIRLPKEAALVAMVLQEVSILIETDTEKVPQLKALLTGISQGIQIAKGGI